MESEYHQRGPVIAVGGVLVLVVLFVIGFSLLLPAIQAASEAGRRAGCIKRFKQLGLGFQNMESAKGRFPPSCHVKKDAEGNIISLDGWSWCIDILPYMEAKSIYDTLDIAGGVPLDGTTAHADALAWIMYELQCPSFEGSRYVDSATEAEAITNYKVIGATHMESLNVASPNPTVPRYNTLDRTKHPDGVIYPGSRHGVKQIPDGSSRTVLIVESVEQNVARWTVGNETCVVALPPTVTFEGPTDSIPYWHPTGYTPGQFWGDSTIPPAINKTYLNWDYDAIPYDDGGISTPSAAASGPIKYGPSSHHVDVTNHGFADGSVHAISNDIDAALYMFMVTRNNSDPVSSYSEE